MSTTRVEAVQNRIPKGWGATAVASGRRNPDTLCLARRRTYREPLKSRHRYRDSNPG
jgi:hypothetical protein